MALTIKSPQKTNETSPQLLTQLILYTAVSGIAFFVDFLVLITLTEYANIHYLLSATISFFLGMITNYMLSVGIVFSNHRFHSRSMEFAIFGLIGLTSLMVNDFVMYFSVEFMGINYTTAKLIATGISFICNFSFRRIILFSQHH